MSEQVETRLEAGAELDERVCRAVGIEPEIERRNFGEFKIDHWPKVSADANAALLVDAEMQKRGWILELRRDATGSVIARYENDRKTFRWHESRTEAHARALAALAALESEKG